MDSQTTAFPSEQKTMSRPVRDGTARALLFSALAVQAAHLVALLLAHHAVLISNILQLLAPLICAALCLHNARSSDTRSQRRLWRDISAAFLLWSIAQGVFLYSLLFKVIARHVPYSDVLWLISGFPILLIVSRTPSSSRRDGVQWLDTAQSSIFFVIVFALLYSKTSTLTLARAYSMQSVALLLGLSIRYSVSEPGADRLFYRNVTLYMAVYWACSALGYSLAQHGALGGTMVDVCWTLPFTFFIVLVLSRGSFRPFRKRTGRPLNLPRHLHGISAIGLATMSMAGSAVFAQHHSLAGRTLVGIAFLLFAARTAAREWQMQTAHERLQSSALHDSLTGLANRSKLELELDKRLQSTVGGFAATHRRTGLLFIDLDRFKTINDGLGHAFGDLLLRRVAALLVEAVRSQDIVARYGGDEFVVLLDQVDTQEAELLAQRIVDQMRTPMDIDGRIVHVTGSVGVVMSGPGDTSFSMIQYADCAMYKAKGLGKNRAQIFAPKMLTAAKSKLDVETDLRQALTDGTIEVHYQPIYALPGNTIVGFEALARWQHPQRGMVSPALFIPVAEDTGLIVELGRQVLRRACKQCQTWNARYGSRFTVAVNVSAIQFAHPGLLEEIIGSLHDSGLDPRLLKLEVTESVLLSGYHVVEEVLGAARALGIAVCLDDFGTGYSSLSYLLRFPFDVIKVDRSFVRHLDRDHRRAEMVRMVIHLASTLKKTVVAEGVESEEELAFLRDFQCDMVQGYLLSKPLSPGAVAALLDNEQPVIALSRPLKRPLRRTAYLPPAAESLPALP